MDIWAILKKILILARCTRRANLLFFWQHIVISDSLAHFVQIAMFTVLYLALKDHLQDLGTFNILLSLQCIEIICDNLIGFLMAELA
jgi:hypothetical protein